MPEPEPNRPRRIAGWGICVVVGVLALGPAVAAEGKGIGGLAPPAATSSAQTFDGITLEELEQIVKGAGYDYKRVPHPGQDSGDSIELTNKAGFRYDLSLGDCAKSGEVRCQSVNLWSINFNENPNITLKSLNDFNNKSWGVRAMLYTDGTSGICMNLGTDGGVSAKWIVARLNNFDTWISIYSDFIAGKPL